MLDRVPWHIIHPLDHRNGGLRMITRIEQYARQYLPSGLRRYLAPVWHNIKSPILKNHTLTRKSSVDQLQDYVSVHFDYFQKAPYLVGQCNICGKQTVFFCEAKALYRESLICAECHTTSRYRSIARGILKAIKELTFREANTIAGLTSIHENVSVKIYDTQVPFYIGIHAYPIPDLLSNLKWLDIHQSIYQPDRPWGMEFSAKVTNQNLEALTYPDNSFDIIIISDVMEHVRLDEKAHQEVRRVLRPGGIYIFTVPNFRDRIDTLYKIAVMDPSDPSKDQYLMERDYHGDPNSPDGKSLCYRYYGTELDEKLRDLGFSVEYTFQDYPGTGIMNTELFYCRLSK
jgi:SAM-dependent methyltransferase